MLVFYEWSAYGPIACFKVLAARIWTPDAASLEAIEQDWATIRQLEIEGRRAAASESLTTLLGAATKGAGHGSTSRAWSLKQPFVGWIYRSMVGEVQTPITTKHRVDPAGDFERNILAKLHAVEGKTIAEAARIAGTTVSRAKSASANVVRTYLGEKSKGRAGDFDRYGVEVKLVPIHRGEPVEFDLLPELRPRRDCLRVVGRVRSARTAQPNPIHPDRAHEGPGPGHRTGRASILLVASRTRTTRHRGRVGAMSPAHRRRPRPRPTDGVRIRLHLRSNEGP